MNVFLIILWLVIGFAFGFIVAAYAASEMDKTAVRDGVIKLCGSIYRLEKIDI